MFLQKKDIRVQWVYTLNFNKGAKYEKTTNFNLQEFYFIQNDKALLNDTEHQNKLIYKMLQKLISFIAVKC